MKTGLNVIPRTQEDLRVINEAIGNSDFYTEYNSTYEYYFFPEEEANYDELEAQIHNLFGGLNADYTIEVTNQ
jgi:hypothetical protein